MGKQRKARRRSLRPPLSLLDKSIYWAGFLVSLVFAGALYIFIFRLLDIIAFRDPSVIAYKSHGTHLFTIPFLLYLGLRRWTKGYRIKQPNMDCQPTEITALMRHRAVFS